jgi:hypothetical protein
LQRCLFADRILVRGVLLVRRHKWNFLCYDQEILLRLLTFFLHLSSDASAGKNS